MTCGHVFNDRLLKLWMNSDYGHNKTATGRATVYVHRLHTVCRYGEGRRTIKNNTEVGDRSSRGVSIRTEAKLGHLFVCLFDLGGTSLVRPGADGGVFYA